MALLGLLRWVPATSLQGGLLALVFAWLPFLVGWWAGRLAPRRGVRALVLLAIAPTVGWLALRLEGLSTLDALWLGVMSGLGVFFSTRARPAAAFAVTFVSLTAALAVGEFVARRLLVPVAGLPPVTEMAVVFESESVSHGCQALAPELATTSPDGFAGRMAAAGAGQRPLKVLHVGDSMLEGAGVSLDETVTAELGRLQPDVAHVNAGYGGTGTDLHLEVIRRWTEWERFDLVVLYPFGNDVADVGRPYSCCGGGPLVSWDGDEPTWRCDKPLAAHGLLKLRTDPLPYALRVAATWSRLAGALVLVLEKARIASANDEKRHAALHRHIAALTLERGVPLLVFPLELGPAPSGQPDPMLPWRDNYPPQTHLIEDLPVLIAEFASAGAETIYQAPNDPHWTPEGHRRVARFLAPQIRALLPTAATSR